MGMHDGNTGIFCTIQHKLIFKKWVGEKKNVADKCSLFIR